MEHLRKSHPADVECSPKHGRRIEAARRTAAPKLRPVLFRVKGELQRGFRPHMRRFRREAHCPGTRSKTPPFFAMTGEGLKISTPFRRCARPYLSAIPDCSSGTRPLTMTICESTVYAHNPTGSGPEKFALLPLLSDCPRNSRNWDTLCCGFMSWLIYRPTRAEQWEQT